ncbi:MAG: DUF2182 domain-containing protein [Flavobacteriaceae bacterium]|nr:DUF2182 domain-containing protein [Flavobacteriaceae bacterium]
MSFVKSIEFQTIYRKYIDRIRVFQALNPEWWVVLLSGLVWIFLCLQNIRNPISIEGSSNQFQLCYSISSIADGSASSVFSIRDELTILYRLVKGNMISWSIMIVAMMFPLLERSIRHVGTSVRRTQRDLAISLFLLGYVVVWLGLSIGFLSLPRVLAWVLPSSVIVRIPFIVGSLFIIMAFFSWHPSRRAIMMKCEFTMPIRIYGWKFYKDAISYGLKIGWACLGMCWLVMTALMIARHNFALMFLVSCIVIVERYLVSHENKLPGYAWMILGIVLFGLEFINILF